MTFNYFNPGRTAWGKKISAVFNTLDMMATAATERVNEVTSDMDFYLQFTNRNYRAPDATRGDLPAKVEDLLSTMTSTVKIKDATYSNGTLSVNAIYYSPVLVRPVMIAGTTNLTTGYAYAKPANGSQTIKGNISFSSTRRKADGLNEIELFSFKVIDGEVYLADLANVNTTEKGSIQIEDFIISRVGTNSYTAKDAYECVIITGGDTWHNVQLNGVTIWDVGSLQHAYLQTTLYLRKGDKISGATLTDIYKITYNRRK